MTGVRCTVWLGCESRDCSTLGLGRLSLVGSRRRGRRRHGVAVAEAASVGAIVGAEVPGLAKGIVSHALEAHGSLARNPVGAAGDDDEVVAGRVEKPFDVRVKLDVHSHMGYGQMCLPVEHAKTARLVRRERPAPEAPEGSSDPIGPFNLGLEGLGPWVGEQNGLCLFGGELFEASLVCLVLPGGVERLDGELEDVVFQCCINGAENHVPSGVVA